MKKVVIIGGGFTGAYCAKKLQKDYDVTLLDTKDYFEFTPGILRSFVEPQHLKKIHAPHKKYLKKATIIIGEATKITDKQVYTQTQELPYDYLIISSGSRYETPIKQQRIIQLNRINNIKEFNNKIRIAHSLLIIGGGIVGVELAAEIAEHYPGKRITIVHKHERLMERMNEEASTYAKTFLEKKGVTVLLNETLNEKSEEFITNSGKKIGAELAFLCIGITPNTEFMHKKFHQYLEKRCHIITTPTLNFDHYQHIFVGGDLTDIKEEKTAQNAEEHAKLIVKNIQLLEQGKKLQEYKQQPRIMVISLGKKHGILTYKKFTVKGIIPGILKHLIEWKSMRNYR